MKTGLKVVSIFMIIGGIVGIIVGVVVNVITALFGSLFAAAGETASAGLLILTGVVALAAGIIELIAGIKGTKAVNNTALCPSCFKLGIVIIALNVVSEILTLANGGSFDVLTFVTGLALPVAYVILAKRVEAEGNAPAENIQ